MKDGMVKAGRSVIRTTMLLCTWFIQQAIVGLLRDRSTRTAVACVLSLACISTARSQLWFDLNGDGFGDRCDSELRTDAFDPVVSRFVVYSGLDGGVLLARPSDEADDLFGHTITSMGDLDGDGVIDLAVSAPASVVTPRTDGMPATHRGRVHLISGSDGRRLAVAANPSQTADATMGLGLASVWDADGDGMRDVFVGGVRPAPGAERHANGFVRLQAVWWLFSSADGSLVRWGIGEVGDAATPYLEDGQSALDYWNSNMLEGVRTALPGLAGDLDGDGEVDGDDAARLTAILDQGGEDERADTATFQAAGLAAGGIGDLDRDGNVDRSDLQILWSQNGLIAEQTPEGARGESPNRPNGWIDCNEYFFDCPIGGDNPDSGVEGTDGSPPGG